MWKQKGEEYRVTVGNGWYWVSATRLGNFTPHDSVGLRSVAVKLRNRRLKAAKLSKSKGGEGDKEGGGEEAMDVGEMAEGLLLDKAADETKPNSQAAKEESVEETQEPARSESVGKDKEVVEAEKMDVDAASPEKTESQADLAVQTDSVGGGVSCAIKPITPVKSEQNRKVHSTSPLYHRLIRSTRNWGNFADKKDAELAEEIFSKLPEKVTDCEVINVSEAMQNRTYYAKMTKPYSKLDSLLERRTKLEEQEVKQRNALEQQILWKTKLEQKAKRAKAEKEKASSEALVNGLPERKQLDSPTGCYSLLCRTLGPRACYSPICRALAAEARLPKDAAAAANVKEVKSEVQAKSEPEVKSEVEVKTEVEASSQDASSSDSGVEMAAKVVKEEPADVDSSGSNLAANVSMDDEEIDVEGDKEGENSSSASNKLLNSVKDKTENGSEESISKAASGEAADGEAEDTSASTTTPKTPTPTPSSSTSSGSKDGADSGKEKVGDMPPGIKDALSVAHILSNRPGITLSQAQQALMQAIMKMSTAELRAKIPPPRKTADKFRLPRSGKVAAKQRSKVMKKASLPVCQKFQTPSKRKSIFVLESHELFKLARRGGFKETPGFNYNCKMNNVGWIYPCPRPFFKTAWRYRTQTLSSLAAAALQLHILWGCTRWDDLAVKPPAGGTNTISTETEITTTELLKRRDTGPQGIRSEFLVRKIVVPLGIASQPKGDFAVVFDSFFSQIIYLRILKEWCTLNLKGCVLFKAEQKLLE